METEQYTSVSEEDTHSIAAQFAAKLRSGDVVTLGGELGVGKTEFVRGVCSFFHVDDIVTSPTFSIINIYNGQLPSGEGVRIVHVDLYRLKNKHELQTIGLEEWLALPDAIKLIEWPEKANGALNMPHYHVTIRAYPGLDDKRQILITHIPALTSAVTH